MGIEFRLGARLRVWLWFGFLTLLFLAALLALASFLAYRAATHVPDFYRESLVLDPQAAAQATDRVLKKAAALSNEAGQPGAWSIEFTEDEINGWLAYDLPENHPRALPAGISDPRVHIEKNDFTLACRAERKGVQTVITVTVDGYVTGDGEVAVRVKRARAGILPLPMEELIEKMIAAATKAGLGARRMQQEGDPVILFDVHGLAGKKEILKLQTVEIGDGVVRLSGVTLSRENAEKAASS